MPKITANCIYCAGLIDIRDSVPAETVANCTAHALRAFGADLRRDNGCFAGIAVPLRRRGGRKGYICAECLGRLREYSCEDFGERGTGKKHRFSYGYELETAAADPVAWGELGAEGFVPTYDSTIDTEFKSPVFWSGNAVIKSLATVDALLRADHLYISDRCGCHLHIGHPAISGNMGWIRTHMQALFRPLSDAIVALPDEGAAFFGRPINNARGWSEPYTDFTRPNHHSIFVNLQHDKTIEFRQPFFRDAEQYGRVVHFARAVAEAVVDAAEIGTDAAAKVCGYRLVGILRERL